MREPDEIPPGNAAEAEADVAKEEEDEDATTVVDDALFLRLRLLSLAVTLGGK